MIFLLKPANKWHFGEVCVTIMSWPTKALRKIRCNDTETAVFLIFGLWANSDNGVSEKICILLKKTRLVFFLKIQAISAVNYFFSLGTVVVSRDLKTPSKNSAALLNLFHFYFPFFLEKNVLSIV